MTSNAGCYEGKNIIEVAPKRPLWLPCTGQKIIEGVEGRKGA
jgi:hypothetical protein